MAEVPLTLMYHGIIPAVPGRDCAQLGVIYQRDFARQMRFLKRFYRVLHPDEVIEHFETGRPFRPRSVLLTFDDGFQNLLDYALPVTEAQGIVPVAFVNTQHLDGGEWLWFARYFASLLASGQAWRPPAVAHTDLDSLDAWLERIRAPRRTETDALHNRLFDGASSAGLQAAVRRGALVIGGHTTRHPRLTSEAPATVTAEIVDNKRALEALINQPVRLFAYPQGLFDATVATAVKDAGYAAAFAVAPQKLPDHLQRYDLPRVGIYRSRRLDFWLKCLGFEAVKGRIQHVAHVAFARK